MKRLETKYELNWQDKNFFKHFTKNIKSFSSTERQSVEEKFVIIFNSQKNEISDKQSQSHLLMCSLILAAFERLIMNNSKEDSIQELTTALKQFGGKYIRWSMKIMLWVKRDKKKFIENAAIKKSGEIYGKSFMIEELRNDNTFSSIVKKCGYYEFFKRNGIPELTKVFCEWDSLWADEINRQKCGIRFERPTTIANNDEDCRFEFHYDE